MTRALKRHRKIQPENEKQIYEMTLIMLAMDLVENSEYVKKYLKQFE